MAISKSYIDYVVDQLQRVSPVTTRKMFGALGIYSGGRIFALADDDTLYFKVNDSNRQEYLDAGMPAFMPGGMPMGYYQVPADVLEDDSKLREWMGRAIAAANVAKAKKRGAK